MKFEVKDIKGKIKKQSMITMALVIVSFFIFGFLYYRFVIKKSKTYMVIDSDIKKSINTQAVVIKQEQKLKINSENLIIPLTEQGKRVRKTESIAIYKDGKYNEYLNKINELDKQIEVLIKDLPQIHSNDISYIELQIQNVSKEAKNTTSFIKMQEYKARIDELSNQKITLLGELSPQGSKVRELIDARKKVENDYINQSDNIKAPISGCVTYRIDGMEESTSTQDIKNYELNKIDEIFEMYKQNKSNDFGIKIVNNFEAYIIVKVANNEYIKEGNNYYINFTDKLQMMEYSNLLKVVNIDSENSYCIFKISNGIEKLIDSRMENVEIVWTKRNGMVVPLDVIKDQDNSSYAIVTLIKNGDYLPIPVKIILTNENMALVENLTKEEKEQNDIKTDYKLEIYDQLVREE